MKLQPVDRDVKLEVMTLLAQGIKPIDVSKRCGISQRMVYKIWNTFKVTGDVETKKKPSGRSRKLCPEIEEVLTLL